MPAVSPSALIAAIMDGFQRSGGAAFVLSERLRMHPRRFVVEYLGNSLSVWMYVWTLTPGGRDSLPDEFRIQMTSVESPLPLNPSGYTVLMGFYPDLHLFAGFDLAKHRSFTPGSSSVQIDIKALHHALQTGLSFHRKTNDEIAVGVRPDQLVNYVVSAALLHKYGAEAQVNALLTKAVDPAQQLDSSIEKLSAERQKIVIEISRYSRSANFRKAVLEAYDNRCAVSRAQMRLVDAAHILPVAAQGSIDHVSNGIALAPSIHRAYDNCLIYLDTALIMRLNPERAKQLRIESLDSGIRSFSSLLDKPINVPRDPAQRPKPQLVALANAYRRIPGYC